MEAFRARALEVNLSEAEVNHLVGNGNDTLARLAFAACLPEQSPTDQQVRDLFPTAYVPSAGDSLKRLIFEAQTLVVADVKQKVTKKDDQATVALAPAERESRIKDQRQRLTGLRLRGEEEVAHQCFDLILSMIDKDSLVYFPPEKFITRRAELQHKKPIKELSIDSSSLVVKDKQPLHHHRARSGQCFAQEKSCI